VSRRLATLATADREITVKSPSALLARPSGMVIHLVAHATRDARPFLDFAVAKWAWEHLRAAFARVFSAALMPDHLHLIAAVRDLEAARRALARMLADLQRVHRQPGTWGRVPEPTVITGRDKLLRNLKYVPINPVREKLVSDPLCWMFSTHRDIVGAVVDPWVDREAVALALGVHPRDLAPRLHKYVSSDPWCSPNGTPLPRPASRTVVATQPISDIVAAAAACHRAQPQQIRERGVVRSTFIGLALEHGWSDLSLLAERCGVTPRAVQMSVAHRIVVPEAASLCLGDERLLTPWPPPRPTLGRRWRFQAG
jgi:hypothetical protein